MRHAREDYNRIQDPSGLIPLDEPVFILRGQDRFASDTVRYYATLVSNAGVDVELVRVVTDSADWMDAWPIHKTPSLKKEIN